jgi:cytochrome c553
MRDSRRPRCVLRPVVVSLAALALSLGTSACSDEEDADSPEMGAASRDEAGSGGDGSKGETKGPEGGSTSSTAEGGRGGAPGGERGNAGGKTASATGGTGGSASTSVDDSDAGTMGTDTGLDAQLPPSDAEAMQKWLAAGLYKDWVCESEPSAKTEGAAAIHVHGGKSRVCTNVRLAASKTSGRREFPRGAASVKELYDDMDKLVATAVSVKVDDTSAGGQGWYWWEGAETSGKGITACAGCHGAAGSDSDHAGAGDYVYFQVRDEAQLPTIGSADEVRVWLEAEHYKRWTCESDKTQKNDGAAAIHVHALNRVCTNGRLTTARKSAGKWPAGVASVKEIYDGDTISGIDVSFKVTADSNDGNGWYWYNGNSADFGLTGCTGCHAAAGSDPEHPGAGDFVYFLNE